MVAIGRVRSAFLASVTVFLLNLVSAPAAAQLTVWFSPHDFGAVEVGQSSPAHLVRVENLSGGPVTITSMQSATPPFAVTLSTCSFPVTLQFLDKCELSYVFSPSAIGNFNQTIDLNWQAGPGNSGTEQIQLFGQGVEPTLIVLPTSLNFGNVDVGQASSTLSFVLDNGSTPDVTVSSIQHPSPPFFHVGGTCSSPPFTLTSIQSCTLDYQFLPTQAGLESDSLVVFANTSSGSVALGLFGNGVSTGSPELTVTPAVVDFGVVQVGLIAGPLPVSLENTGSADLTVTQMDPALAPFFELSSSCGPLPFTLAPGMSCQISYTFGPPTDGGSNQFVFVNSNDPNPAGNVFTLTGLAEDSVIAIPASLIDFLGVPVGQTAVRPMEIFNAGLTFDVMVFGSTGLGPLPPEFAIQPGSCTMFPVLLGPGDSCELLVSFTPSVVGPASHSNVLNHDASAGSGDYTLIGNGLDDEVFADRFQMP